MRFELSTCHHGADDIAGVMCTLDAHASVVLDVAHGRLEVHADATAAQVLGKLQDLGYVARLLEPVHISGGSTCCGQCG